MAVQRVRPGWTVALTSVAFFMVALDALVVITALPAIHAEIGGSVSILEWAINAYLLAFAAGIITAAALGDRFGRRRVYVLGLLLFTIGSAGCAMSQTAEMLIAARAIQGLGAAVITPISLTILTAAFPPERRGTVLGIWGGIAGLATAAGPLVGGGVTQGLSWHWIFWINVPIGLVATVFSAVRLAESHGTATRLDLPGVALVSGGSLGIVLGLVRATDAGWGSPDAIVALVLGVLLMVGVLLWEGRVSEPMLPLRLFAIRTVAAASTTAFLMAATLFSAVFLVSLYLQFALGYSPLGAGVRVLPWTATVLVVAPAAGALSDRIGTRPLMVAGMLIQAAGLGWFALVAGVGVGYESFFVPLLLAGIGVSMVLPATPTAVLSAVEPKDMGKASGLNNTLQRFGGVFGVAVTSAVFASSGHLGTAAGVTAGFRPALTVSALLSVLGAASALVVASRRPASVPAKEPIRAAVR
jgi:EmrB/QacA subfamily drug resistance transporter